MEFLQANGSVIMSITLLIVVFVIGFFVLPLMKRKGLIEQEDAKTTREMMIIVRLLLENVKFESKEIKDKTLLVMKIAEESVRYVEQIMKDENNKVKKETAYKTILKILKELEVEVTDNMKELIEVSLESAVSRLPKTN